MVQSDNLLSEDSSLLLKCIIILFSHMWLNSVNDFDGGSIFNVARFVHITSFPSILLKSIFYIQKLILQVFYLPIRMVNLGQKMNIQMLYYFKMWVNIVPAFYWKSISRLLFLGFDVVFFHHNLLNLITRKHPNKQHKSFYQLKYDWNFKNCRSILKYTKDSYVFYLLFSQPELSTLTLWSGEIMPRWSQNWNACTHKYIHITVLQRKKIARWSFTLTSSGDFGWVEEYAKVNFLTEISYLYTTHHPELVVLKVSKMCCHTVKNSEK